MHARVMSYGIQGIAGFPVLVEANISSGLPSFDIVGLPDAAVKESRERVRAAITNSGMKMPVARVVINLAPADTRKVGPSFDLPIALAVLISSGQVETSALGDTLFIGELSLDGRIMPVRGALSVALSASTESLITRMVLPASNAPEASCLENVAIYPAATLSEVVDHLRGARAIAPQAQTPYQAMLLPGAPLAHDVRHVYGQQGAKRALEVSAAGGHNMLMVGSPGSGKTMLARCLPGILPDMSFEEALEVTRIHSVAGTLPAGGRMMTTRPFRTPHHTASKASLIGGGREAMPGELTLAHHGVLFLDELPEYTADVLESLRQPLEDGEVSVTRVHARCVYPCRVMLVAAMNPCPCGNHGDPHRVCRCTPRMIQRYLARISGPLLDRIDLRVSVESVPVKEIRSGVQAAESSATVRARINAARARQQARYARLGFHANAQLGAHQLRQYCACTPEAERLLQRAMAHYDLTMRGYARVLKVALTVADLDASDAVAEQHIAEALQYRALDKSYWS